MVGGALRAWQRVAMQGLPEAAAQFVCSLPPAWLGSDEQARLHMLCMVIGLRLLMTMHMVPCAVSLLERWQENGITAAAPGNHRCTTVAPRQHQRGARRVNMSASAVGRTSDHAH
jgi:hypothetical protein